MKPSIVAICLLPLLPSLGLATWEPLGSGTDGPVYALAVFDGQLIAGGEFTHAGGVPVNHIARWDGASWQQLGPGLDGNGVYALTVYDGCLIAGGWFRSAGGLPVNHIARWDGASWSPLDVGVGAYDGEYVQALAVYDGKLIAAGPFTQAGGQSARYVAQWNGTSWSPMGPGMNERGCALAAYAGRLIAGGFFTMAGGQPAAYIAQWDGSSWSAMGSGMNAFVTGLGLYAGSLVAGGYFTQAGGGPASFVASWDGDSWSPLGSGTDNAVQALAGFEGDLIAGGFFGHAGGIPASRIARWDGSSWTALGSGVNSGNGVSVLLDRQDRLIVGGHFTQAGDLPADHIAQWIGDVTPVRLESWQAASSPEGLDLRWELPLGTTGVLGRAWRDPYATRGDARPTPGAELVSSVWVSPSAEGIIEILDPAPAPGIPTGYFLEISDGDGGRMFLGPMEACWVSPDLQWKVGPNPFRVATRLAPPSAGPARVEIFDAAGRLVRTLECLGGGSALEWDGRDGHGRELPAGIYLARLDGASGGAIRRLTRIE